jgi:hypothetical protein
MAKKRKTKAKSARKPKAKASARRKTTARRAAGDEGFFASFMKLFAPPETQGRKK